MMTPAVRTALASALILAAGLGTLALATDGFQVYTAESARRLAVTTHPVPLPPARLQAASGETLDLNQFRGQWVLADFIYTRCLTYCSVLGGEFGRLQDQLAGPLAAGHVTLLSISFDPAHDNPTALAAYQQRSGDRGAGWVAARPVDTQGLADLKDAFGVVTVPDGLGGFLHNAAINIIDPQGRLTAIFDWDQPEAAARYLHARLP